MKKIFNKVMAGAMTAVMVASLFVGVSIASSTVKADSTDVSSAITPWVVYSAGQIGRSTDPDGWPVRYYNNFTTTAGESKSNWDANFKNQQYVDSGEETWNTTKPANGFTANIAGTGWDGEWEGKNLIGDNPYMLRATMPSIKLKEGHFYSISMDLSWTDAANDKGEYNAPEKNVQVLVNDGNTNNLDSQKLTITSGSSVHYTTQKYDNGNSMVATYGTDSIEVVIAMGCFNYSFSQGLTTEKVAATGTLKVENLTIVDEGADPNYVAPPDKPSVPSTQNPTGNNNNPTGGQNVTPTTPSTPAPVVTSKKLAKVKKLKAKNTKKGTVKITWKKVAKAKTYQVKVGKKTYTAKKASLVVKKLKKGKKYTVKVRAKAAGYKAGAWATVKVKIKK